MIKNVLIFIIVQIVFLYPSYYLYRVIVKRFNYQKIKRAALLLTFLMPFIYTTVFIVVYRSVIDPIIRSQDFEKKIWIEDIYSRYKIVNDLIKRDLLIGKTKEEVISVLGKEHKENCWGENTLCYPTYDPDNYALLDHYELILFFDSKGLVERVSVELI